MSNQSCCCDKTFSDYIAQCPAGITLYTLNLTPSTDFLVVIASSVFGSISVVATTNEDGYLFIDGDDLPEGFLNQYSGTFKLRVYEITSTPYECSEVKLMLGRRYDNVELELKSGAYVKDYVGCPAPDLIAE